MYKKAGVLWFIVAVVLSIVLYAIFSGASGGRHKRDTKKVISASTTDIADDIDANNASSVEVADKDAEVTSDALESSAEGKEKRDSKKSIYIKSELGGLDARGTENEKVDAGEVTKNTYEDKVVKINKESLGEYISVQEEGVLEQKEIHMINSQMYYACVVRTKSGVQLIYYVNESTFNNIEYDSKVSMTIHVYQNASGASKMIVTSMTLK